MKPRKKKLNLTVSAWHRTRAIKLAKKLNRSISNLFEWLIDRAYDQQHKLPADAPRQGSNRNINQ